MNSEPKPRSDRGFAFAEGAVANPRTSGEPMHRSGEAWFLGISLGALYAVAIALSLSGAARTDELYHYAQIHLFRHGDFRVLDFYLTTIPGYHAAVAALLWISGLDSLGAARAITAMFGLAAAAIFHATRKRLYPGTESLATAQFLVLPVLAPFFFLVYTDVLALALVLAATLATLARRHWLSATILCAVVLVRQNDVIWAGFLAALTVWPLLRRDAAWRELVALAVPYALPIAGFLAFWAWNGSISLSREQAGLHPEMSFRSGNVFFALLAAGALFPLQAVAGLRDFVALARKHLWLIAIPPLLFAAFWWGFRADNPYNSALPDFYLHNAVLKAISTTDTYWRALAGLLVVLGGCGLALTRLRPAAAAWLYPFAALFLAASWLVESRYVLIPFSLWLGFREHRSRAIEYATLALWTALAVLIFAGMITGRLFP